MRFLLSLAVLISFHVTAADLTRWSALSKELKGFAAGTTGGKDGSTYTVTNNKDYLPGSTAVSGSLRYGIEKVSLGKPLWINFKLPVGSEKISLKAPLKLRSNLTIDGQSKVTLVTVINWSLFEIDPNSLSLSRPQCRRKSTSTVQPAFISIIRQKNIIVTGLTFYRENYYKSPWEAQYPNLDRECLGDVISIGHNDKAGIGVDNIWVHNNVIQTCGDGCVDATRPDPYTTPHRITISKNIFQDTDKTMIMGGDLDAFDGTIPAGKYPYRVTIYGNTFDHVTQRNPRATASIIHVYKNSFLSWKSYIVYASNAKVFYESNTHNNTEKRPIIADGSVSVYPYDNKDLSGASVIPNMTGYLEYRAKWIPYAP